MQIIRMQSDSQIDNEKSGNFIDMSFTLRSLTNLIPEFHNLSLIPRFLSIKLWILHLRILMHQIFLAIKIWHYHWVPLCRLQLLVLSTLNEISAQWFIFSCFHIFTMDVLLNGHPISAKEELQLLCCIMGKTMSADVTFWLLMIGDW